MFFLARSLDRSTFSPQWCMFSWSVYIYWSLCFWMRLAVASIAQNKTRCISRHVCKHRDLEWFGDEFGYFSVGMKTPRTILMLLPSSSFLCVFTSLVHLTREMKEMKFRTNSHTIWKCWVWEKRAAYPLCRYILIVSSHFFWGVCVWCSVCTKD